jgi:hypothetical protein
MKKKPKTADNPATGPWKIGEKYFIRTVTMTLTGLLVNVWAQELELDQACWIADSGRFHKALKGDWDSSAEFEPFPGEVIVGRGSIVDAALITCELPKAVK